MFKVGDIVVLQNLVGRYAHMNGVETVVVQLYPGKKPMPHPYKTALKYPSRRKPGRMIHMCCAAFEMRLKRPPSGQQKIMDLFKLPAPELIAE